VTIFQDAFLHAALVIVGFVVAALALALVDLRARRTGTLEHSPSAEVERARA